MKIGIISDSHDHMRNLGRVLARLGEEGVESVIHCGDFCAPFVLKELDGLGVPVHGVFGNVDGDRHLMTRMALTELENIRLHGETAEIELGGWRIGANHYPALAEGLASTGRFDLVVYGHTHRAEMRRVGDCRLVNPGEVMGRLGTVGYAIVDTDAGDVTLHTL
jgi:uncharacterized protein